MIITFAKTKPLISENFQITHFIVDAVRLSNSVQVAITDHKFPNLTVPVLYALPFFLTGRADFLSSTACLLHSCSSLWYCRQFGMSRAEAEMWVVELHKNGDWLLWWLIKQLKLILLWNYWHLQLTKFYFGFNKK